MNRNFPKFSIPVTPPAARRGSGQMFSSVHPTLDALRKAGREDVVQEAENILKNLENKLHRELLAAGMIG